MSPSLMAVCGEYVTMQTKDKEEGVRKGKGSLCDLDINPRSDVYLARVVSHSVSFFFPRFSVSVAVQNCFSFLLSFHKLYPIHRFPFLLSSQSLHFPSSPLSQICSLSVSLQKRVSRDISTEHDITSYKSNRRERIPKAYKRIRDSPH